MKSFVIRKWWRQLFVVAKQEQRMQAEAGGGDCIASAWRMHVARKSFRLARKRHVIKCKTLAVSVVQRSIKSHAARVALKAAAVAAAAAANERALVKALAYEVTAAAAVALGCFGRCENVLHVVTASVRYQASSARRPCCKSSSIEPVAFEHQLSSTGKSRPFSFLNHKHLVI
jgi:hypothetical protein